MTLRPAILRPLVCLTSTPQSPTLWALVRAKFAQAFVVCALVFAIGAHWTLLQSIAWVGMAVSYTQNSTLKEALLKTFDGKHPCTLCKVVQQGKNAQKKQD